MLQTRVDSIDQDIELIIRESFSPAARSSMLVEFAREQLSEAQQTNKQVLGAVPPHETYVDGVRSDRLESVRPDGAIAFEFSLFTDAVRWVAEQLETHSPKRSGRYAKSNILLADGVEIDLDAIPPGATEFVFVNSQPYARKIESGLSSQAPDGVYEVVSILAAQRFGNTARFRFTYRSADGGTKDREARQPAIVITV